MKTFYNGKAYQAPKTLVLPHRPIVFVWVLSIDTPVSNRATWSLPSLLVSTLKLSSGNSTQTGELLKTEIIDPTILGDHAFPGDEQIQATENISGL